MRRPGLLVDRPRENEGEKIEILCGVLDADARNTAWSVVELDRSEVLIVLDLLWLETKAAPLERKMAVVLRS
jgi:hypothetical protein